MSEHSTRCIARTTNMQSCIPAQRSFRMYAHAGEGRRVRARAQLPRACVWIGPHPEAAAAVLARSGDAKLLFIHTGDQARPFLSRICLAVTIIARTSIILICTFLSYFIVVLMNVLPVEICIGFTRWFDCPRVAVAAAKQHSGSKPEGDTPTNPQQRLPFIALRKHRPPHRQCRQPTARAGWHRPAPVSALQDLC